jgi:hypothetical protein
MDQIPSSAVRSARQRQEKEIVLEQDAPPVIIKGKRAEDLTDDERKDFLREKIKDIYQEDGEVELIRLSPGYPTTLTFEDRLTNFVLGDSTMVKIDQIGDGRTLVLNALEREGQTTLQIFFGGQKVRVYDLEIPSGTPFVQAPIAIRVAGFGKSPQNTNSNGAPAGGIDVRSITTVIANYDALLQEGSINSQTVKRTPVFKVSNAESFTVYYIYQFASGPLAISFAYKNPYNYPIRYNESQLRIQLGNMKFLPDYVSIQKTTLQPGEVTTGFAVVNNPSFTPSQPFELIWK